jgi:D-alanyl-lipoteichoic acid acyltransferase DltB (MBOAT superfamily)
MLFNSPLFIFVFLPTTIFGFYLIGRYRYSLAIIWLAAASLFFYGYWNPAYIPLLIGSITCNYIFGIGIIKHSTHKKPILLFALLSNLLLLGYFKYVNFFLANISPLMPTKISLFEIILPLGISFFTFTQIAYLIDTYQGKVKEFSFIRYLLFVTYFPHLIAGPVLHHKEMIPQFTNRNVFAVNWNNISVGLTIFTIGLAKKLFFADHFGDFANPIFSAVDAGKQPMLFEAWAGSLSYSMQLYFDFSGYSDMAIGLSLLFNVRLPMNFNSPYKATNIIEFWRCWHMTLSRFLRDYLYIPLGGNKKGKVRRYVNLMLTMILGGLWHGASWTFIAWGAIHGLFLILNHVWLYIKQILKWDGSNAPSQLCARILTFTSVVVAWVFFRADNFTTAISMLHGMAGINGISLPISMSERIGGFFSDCTFITFNGFHPLLTEMNVELFTILFVFGSLIIWVLPNVQQIFSGYSPTCDEMSEDTKTDHSNGSSLIRLIKWKPSFTQGVLYGILFSALMIEMQGTSKSEFLYFQF